MLGLDTLDFMILLHFALLVSIVWSIRQANGLICKGFNEVIEGLQQIDERLAKSGSRAASKEKTCPACGASVEEGAKFCAKCGGAL
jgi:hypothetical protein